MIVAKEQHVNIEAARNAIEGDAAKAMEKKWPQYVLGTDGTIHKSQQLRYTPQKVNQPAGVEIAGDSKTAPQAHMRNFFDCVRSGATPNCPFEIGFRTSIACRMAVESYRQGRPMVWDAAKEEIVT